MKNRTDIKDFIVEIEKNFQVNDWQANGIHLWPILRIRLYFYLIKEIENPQKNDQQVSVISKNKSFLHTINQKIKQFLFVSNYLIWYSLLPSKKNLFLGNDGHRVNYKSKRFNRYFDVFIEKYHLQSQSLYLEYDKLPLKNQFHKNLIYSHRKPLLGFTYLQKVIGTTHKTQFNWNGYTTFYDFLELNEVTKKFAQNNSVANLETWFSNFNYKIFFFNKILKKINPTKILILCYYSDDVMALIIAANHLKIQTIEMQHGPQTEIHLSYGSWTKVPINGYDMLPRNYWCWDTFSQSILNTWINKNTLYKTELVGNPWVDYWKKNEIAYKYSDYILYSLQPKPVTIAELFPNEIIHFIKQYPYKWFLRLHPRQLTEKVTIEKFLKEQNVLHLVNIEDATNDPLPQLLSNAKIHITHFSGTAIEAALFNVHTVLINNLGVISFPDLIEKKKATFLNIAELQFSNLFLDILNSTDIPTKSSIFEKDLKNINLFD